MMGRITCANVTSDLFAMGVTRIDSLQMIMKMSSSMTEIELNAVVPLMVDGFRSGAKEAKCEATVGCVTVNPWCTLGGIATSVCDSSEFILPVNAVPGDVLVLTKPLGTQIACTVHHWLDVPDKREKIKDVPRSELDSMLKQATRSMSRLNLTAATLMHKHNAHACTDVTGFGILGHADNLAKFQKRDLKFVVERLPVFRTAHKVANLLNMTRLLRGTSPETSGGLLISMSKDDASAFCKEFQEIEQEEVWVVGRVEDGDRTAEVVAEPEVIQVDVSV